MSNLVINVFPTMNELVARLRDDLENKPNEKDCNFILLFAYNGTGKTRLSMEFKEIGKKRTDLPENNRRDTLYFNAFTEDLFYWDNDLNGNSLRVLHLNKNSRFFPDLNGLELEVKIRAFLNRYSDFDFKIDTDEMTVNFKRQEIIDGTSQIVENIKVSRGEESIFIWCFFLAIAQLAIDEHPEYKWVKYLYIDDPISSLDDNNAIYVASHLAQLIKDSQNKLKVIISSHHSLFYNVMWNELKETGKFKPYFLHKRDNEYRLRWSKDTPFFHHVAMIRELHLAIENDKLYTYHFNILRSILEKTASFLGLNNFKDCIKKDPADVDEVIYSRMVDIFNHGNYSLYDPMEMASDNKIHFKTIFTNFRNEYKFNEKLFLDEII